MAWITTVPPSVQRRAAARREAARAELPDEMPALAPGAPPPLSGGDAAAFMAARG